MKKIFSKIKFPTAPDLNIYHWKEADTEFEVPISANYVIAITASAKSAKQNKSNDDDDLRVTIDNYVLGKYEIHEDKIDIYDFDPQKIDSIKSFVIDSLDKAEFAGVVNNYEIKIVINEKVSL